MGKRGLGAEQIVFKLRQIEVLMAQGKTAALACKEAGVSEQSYYRWRKEYGGLEIDQAKRMKELERENQRLKRLVADLSVEKQVLKDIASGNGIVTLIAGLRPLLPFVRQVDAQNQLFRLPFPT